MNGMCVKKKHHMYVAQTSNNRVISSGDLLLLAATVRSFAHMLLWISDRNNIILYIAEKSDDYDLDLVFSYY